MKMFSMEEKWLEKTLKTRVENAGGWCIKLPTIYTRGLPDRMCLFPGAQIIFVEIKTFGKKPTPAQRFVHDRLKRVGFTVAIVDSVESLDKILS